ncbi:MAG: monovalent cation:proton antiporter-2 (CPA2) family protein [Proteobacteria bacterium]|nr:monovalent cation:proton antiporter-2 (CPA2) family protein [Pseudomonadota bacterium]
MFQATIYLGSAVIAVPVAKRLGLGSVLGYLIAGLLIGPVIGLVGTETQNLQHFAEFGVVMMLFVVGLELEPRALWDMRHRLIGLGGLQISLTALSVAAICVAIGQPLSVGLAIGLTFSLSSTAIVLQTLNEKGLMQTPGGRSCFSVLSSQDIAVIPMLALVPLLAIQGYHNDVGHHAAGETMSLVEGLPGWGVTAVTIGAIATVILGGHYLSRPLFRFIAGSHLREMFTAATLLLVIGIALLMSLVGLSPALGTFLAGVVLANSEFRHELESDIEPFKGLLLGLFFITVGAGIDFEILFGDFTYILMLTLGVMAVKASVLLVLARIFKLKGRDQLLFALGLAQAGEFGFVMLGFMVQTNVIPTELSKTLLLVVALSMLLTPALFIIFDLVDKKLRSRGVTEQAADEIDEQAPIIIAGVGRFGQIVNRIVGMSGYKTVVLDHDIETIEVQRKFGMKGFFGDPTRPELMHAAGLMKAKVLVVALDDPKAAITLVKHARKERPDLHIVARAYDRQAVYELYRAGANDIVRETFDSSIRAGKSVLAGMGMSSFEVEQAGDYFFELDRRLLKEMAVLWDPSVSNLENPAFIARAKELSKTLATGFTSHKISNRHDEDEVSQS